MTEQSPYRRVVTHEFRVCDELIAITDFDEDFVYVEEVAKNGQEDSHMSGKLVTDCHGVFIWAEGEEQFIEYHSEKLADGIRQHINRHGLPID